MIYAITWLVIACLAGLFVGRWLRAADPYDMGDTMNAGD